MIFLVMMLLMTIFLYLNNKWREVEHEEKKNAHNKRKVEAEADY